MVEKKTEKNVNGKKEEIVEEKVYNDKLELLASNSKIYNS